MFAKFRWPQRAMWAALVLALALGGLHSQPSAAQAARPVAAADQITHLVQAGETLFKIGLRYGVSWPDIMEANHLPSTTIYAGQTLIIPLSADAPDVPPADEPPPTPSTEATTYTVERGDILSRIAQRFGVTVSQIVAANNIPNPSLIFAGQVLIIPGSNGDTSDPGGAPPPSGGSQEIRVNLTQQRMYVYQDGALIWDWVVSTGEPGRETVPGNFSVLNKIPNAYAATWDLWMPNWMGIYWAGSLQNGIHALPILSNGLRLWDGLLGQRVSFGCVILNIPEAQMLYDWAQVGTPVNITY
jgi:LysM repeat protein